MYRGAMIPGFVLAGSYIVYVIIASLIKPSAAPALPAEARVYREPNGSNGLPSLGILVVIASVGAWLLGRALLSEKSAADEVIVLNLLLWGVIAFVIAGANKLLKLKLLSQIAERVVFVMVPPLLLIFLV